MKNEIFIKFRTLFKNFYYKHLNSIFIAIVDKNFTDIKFVEIVLVYANLLYCSNNHIAYEHLIILIPELFNPNS